MLTSSGKPFVWSYSKWKMYEECPLHFKLAHLDKLPEPTPEKKGDGESALERGDRIHKLAEDFVYGKKKALPTELKKFDTGFKKLKAERLKDDGKLVACEIEWAFDRDWKPTGYLDKNAWLRVKLDVMVLDETAKDLLVIDHKTGKVRQEEYGVQIELYQLAALLREEEVQTVQAQLWFLDHGVKLPEKSIIVTRAHQKTLIKLWEKRIKPMFADKRFAPCPGSACRFCPYSKSKGGPCKF